MCNHKRKIAERGFIYNPRKNRIEAHTEIICKTCGIIETIKDRIMKTTKIIVNAKSKPWLMETINYSEIIVLAHGFHESEVLRNYSITYSKGKSDSSGIVTKGDKVFAVEGMIFNCSMTTAS